MSQVQRQRLDKKAGRMKEIKCVYCNGTGRTPSKVFPCLVCRGEGRVIVKEPVIQCPECKGKGRNPQSKLTCLRCKGIGFTKSSEGSGHSKDVFPFEPKGSVLIPKGE
jgi:RecJ-like exonuclease